MAEGILSSISRRMDQLDAGMARAVTMHNPHDVAAAWYILRFAFTYAAMESNRPFLFTSALVVLPVLTKPWREAVVGERVERQPSLATPLARSLLQVIDVLIYTSITPLIRGEGLKALTAKIGIRVLIGIWVIVRTFDVAFTFEQMLSHALTLRFKEAINHLERGRLKLDAYH